MSSIGRFCYPYPNLNGGQYLRPMLVWTTRLWYLDYVYEDMVSSALPRCNPGWSRCLAGRSCCSGGWSLCFVSARAKAASFGDLAPGFHRPAGFDAACLDSDTSRVRDVRHVGGRIPSSSERSPETSPPDWNLFSSIHATDRWVSAFAPRPPRLLVLPTIPVEWY